MKVVTMRRLIFIAIATIFAAEAISRPPFIKPCRRDDPNLNECAVRHGKLALPYLIKGDNNFKIPSLSPLYVSQIVLQTNRDLTIKLHNVYIKGFETTTIQSINIDLKKRYINGKFNVKFLIIEGQYDVDGRILILPIKGKGPATVSCENLNINFSFDYTLVKHKDGKDYMKPSPPTVEYTVEKIHFKLDNLFNGDKTLADRTVEFLNEHSKEINEDFSSSIAETAAAIITNILNNMVQVPFDEIFD